MAGGTRRLRAATRGSALARWQTEHVAALIAAAAPDVAVEAVVVETTADRRLDIPIAAMGGKGVFVKEVQAALLDGRADIAVHSAKDLPSTAVDGLVLAAVPRRADARDVLVGTSFDALAGGARIATGSARRRVQLAHARPNLVFSDLRGNIATRLGRVGEFDAVVVAKAALDRLGLEPALFDVLDPTVMVPQVGQGALAIECRADDPDTIGVLAAISDGDSRRVVDAERAYLAELGGDCNLPAGAHAVLRDGIVSITGVLASTDESVLRRHTTEGIDGESLGRALARRLFAEIAQIDPLP